MGLRGLFTAGLLSLATLVPGTPRADEDVRSRALEALEKTDRRIEVAGNYVSESPNIPARSELADARHGQTQARTEFSSTQYPLAVSSTLTARDHADRAIAIVRNLPDPNRVQGQVDRTRKELERVHRQVEASGNLRAHSILSVAQGMQDRAEGALTESRYLAALQLTLSARQRGVDASRLCEAGDPLADSVAAELRRTDKLLSRARESIRGARPLARSRLARAEGLQAQAESEAGLERYESAASLTREARVLLRRVVRPARVPVRVPVAAQEH